MRAARVVVVVVLREERFYDAAETELELVVE